MAAIRPEEISAVIQKEIQGYQTDLKMESVGVVLTVGAGIARVYGLDQVQAGEHVEGRGMNVVERQPVKEPLQTGWKSIDGMIPIGRGQRELILGDRQTGKTAIAIDTILNQRDKNVLCVYCAIGQRASAVAKVIANLREKGAMDYTTVVVAEGNNSPGL